MILGKVIIKMKAFWATRKMFRKIVKIIRTALTEIVISIQKLREIIGFYQMEGISVQEVQEMYTRKQPKTIAVTLRILKVQVIFQVLIQRIIKPRTVTLLLLLRQTAVKAMFLFLIQLLFLIQINLKLMIRKNKIIKMLITVQKTLFLSKISYRLNLMNLELLRNQVIQVLQNGIRILRAVQKM